MVKKIKSFLKGMSKRGRFVIMFLYTVPSFVAILFVHYLIYSNDFKSFFNKLEIEVETNKPKQEDDEDYFTTVQFFIYPFLIYSHDQYVFL